MNRHSFLAFTILATGLAAGTVAPTAPRFRQDLQFFARELPRRHKNAFHFSSREQFQTAIADLNTRLDTIDEDAFYTGLMRLASMIGDAPTRVSLPAASA